MSISKQAEKIADELCQHRDSDDWRPTYFGAREALERSANRFGIGMVCGVFLAAAVRVAEFLIS